MVMARPSGGSSLVPARFGCPPSPRVPFSSLASMRSFIHSAARSAIASKISPPACRFSWMGSPSGASFRYEAHRTTRFGSWNPFLMRPSLMITSAVMLSRKCGISGCFCMNSAMRAGCPIATCIISWARIAVCTRWSGSPPVVLNSENAAPTAIWVPLVYATPMQNGSQNHSTRRIAATSSGLLATTR